MKKKKLLQSPPSICSLIFPVECSKILFDLRLRKINVLIEICQLCLHGLFLTLYLSMGFIK